MQCLTRKVSVRIKLIDPRIVEKLLLTVKKSSGETHDAKVKSSKTAQNESKAESNVGNNSKMIKEERRDDLFRSDKMDTKSEKIIKIIKNEEQGKSGSSRKGELFCPDEAVTVVKRKKDDKKSKNPSFSKLISIRKLKKDCLRRKVEVSLRNLTRSDIKNYRKALRNAASFVKASNDNKSERKENLQSKAKSEKPPKLRAQVSGLKAAIYKYLKPKETHSEKRKLSESEPKRKERLPDFKIPKLKEKVSDSKTKEKVPEKRKFAQTGSEPKMRDFKIPKLKENVQSQSAESEPRNLFSGYKIPKKGSKPTDEKPAEANVATRRIKKITFNDNVTVKLFRPDEIMEENAEIFTQDLVLLPKPRPQKLPQHLRQSDQAFKFKVPLPPSPRSRPSPRPLSNIPIQPIAQIQPLALRPLDRSHECTMEMEIVTNNNNEAVKMETKLSEAEAASKYAVDWMIQLAVEFTLQKRWLCPICGVFDTVRGTRNKTAVRMHILKKHAKYFLDVNPLKFKSLPGGLFRCHSQGCSLKLENELWLIFHLAYDHGILFKQLAKQGYKDMTAFEPVEYKAKKDSRRLSWQCLRCTLKFVNRQECMLHIALFHYFRLLLPLQTMQILWKRLGHYPCNQVNCTTSFATLPALLVHEQTRHNAMDVYIGKIIGNNDLYVQIN